MKKSYFTLFLFLLTMPLFAQNYWGSQYEIMDLINSADTSLEMNTNYKRLAFRFTVPNELGDIGVRKMRLHFDRSVGSPTFEYRIETVDAQNLPSGQLVNTNATINYSQGSTGAKTITFSAAFTLSAGNTYCIVIVPSSNASSSIRHHFEMSAPLNHYIDDQDGQLYDDSSLNVLFSTNNGTNWVVENYSPVFNLYDGSSKIIGTPYDNKGTQYINSTNTKLGEVFTLDHVLHITGLSVYATKSGSPQSLYYQIDKVASVQGITNVIQSNIISGNFSGHPYGWLDAYFSDGITLTNGVYRLYFYCTNASGSDYYKLSEYKGKQWSLGSSRDVTWLSTNGYSIKNTGSGWAGTYNINQGDIGFRFILSGVPPYSFNVISPTNIFLSSAKPTFIWHSTTDPEDGGNLTYDLFISPTSDFSSGVISYIGLSSTNFTIEDILRNNVSYYWKVTAQDLDGNSRTTTVATFNTKYAEVSATDKPTPRDKTELYSVVPNIFDRNSDKQMDIVFDIKEEGLVSLVVYDISGAKVASLLNGNLYSGRYKIIWGGGIGNFDASAVDVESSSTPVPVGTTGKMLGRGIYVLVLQTQDSKNMKKIFIK